MDTYTIRTRSTVIAECTTIEQCAEVLPSVHNACIGQAVTVFLPNNRGSMPLNAFSMYVRSVMARRA